MMLYLGYLWITLPDIGDPRSFLASQSTVITDRNGVELYRLFSEEDRTFISGEQIPDHMRKAIISIEDERFYSRGCLDIRAILRAVIGLGQSGGASTLTRQLARNALNLKSENIYNRKLKELVLGCQMESSYSKDELLNLYLNWIPFGQNAYGIEQASQVYFGKPAADLTLAESAVLASLPQRPTYFSPYGQYRNTTVSTDVVEDIISGRIERVSQIPDDQVRIGLLGSHVGTGATVVYIGGRTDQVLKNMQDQGHVQEQERLAALSELETVEFRPTRESIRAPHFVLWVRKQVEDMFSGTSEEGLLERGGLTVETTLDWNMQEEAEYAVDFHREDALSRFGAQNIALVALDPDTREILSYVGNTDYSDQEHGGKIDMVQSPRQPGSSFKPFVYAAAFEKGYSPATVLFDVQTKIGDDEPQNFDAKFFGPLSIRQALGASRNIPAAKAFFLAGGEENILNLVSGMGARSPLERRNELEETRPDGFAYGWPLALGAAETPLLEMVTAYSTFANGGIAKEPISIRRIIDKNGNILYQAEADRAGDQVLDERIAYQVTSILSDESVRPEEYWKTQLTIPGFSTAAKTGTSNKCLEWQESDEGRYCKLRKPNNAWLVGYTPELVAGVWVGNADGSALFDKAGGLNTASPIWRDFLASAHRQIDQPVATFTAPDGIVQAQVSLLSGQLPTECTPVELRRADVFLEERSPTEADPACKQLTVDKVTGLLASDACPDDALEDGSFFDARSVLPERWPKWEEAVQTWMEEQMELWNATDNHSGAILKLPRAPTVECDPSLTPGRLDRPTVRFRSPVDGGKAAYPAFGAVIDYTVGSSVREVRYTLDGRRVAIEESPPYNATIRVPRSVGQSGIHVLNVRLEDEYYNIAEDEIHVRFGEDTDPPQVRMTHPKQTGFRRGDTVTMRAEASDAEGGVRYVQFYLGDRLLSTKPKSPYELEYPLNVDPGVYTLRAVAEDMAKKTAEDSIRITVVEEGAALESLGDISASLLHETMVLEPAIVAPAEGAVFAKGEVLDIDVFVPELDGQNIAELSVSVDSAEPGYSDRILHLSDGGGTYSRDWKGDMPGEYVIVVTVKDGSGAEREVDRRGIIIE